MNSWTEVSEPSSTFQRLRRLLIPADLGLGFLISTSLLKFTNGAHLRRLIVSTYTLLVVCYGRYSTRPTSHQSSTVTVLQTMRWKERSLTKGWDQSVWVNLKRSGGFWCKTAGNHYRNDLLWKKLWTLSRLSWNIWGSLATRNLQLQRSPRARAHTHTHTYLRAPLHVGQTVHCSWVASEQLYGSWLILILP